MAAWKDQQLLDLRDRVLSKQDVLSIANANSLGQLASVREISLSGNTTISGILGDLISNCWQKLETLKMIGCDLTAEDISALDSANSKGYLPSLQELILARTPALAGKVDILLNHPWPELQTIELWSCSLSAQEKQALREARHNEIFPKLVTLSFGYESDDELTKKRGIAIHCNKW